MKNLYPSFDKFKINLTLTLAAWTGAGVGWGSGAASSVGERLFVGVFDRLRGMAKKIYRLNFLCFSVLSKNVPTLVKLYIRGKNWSVNPKKILGLEKLQGWKLCKG